jgi:hypothetical protein
MAGILGELEAGRINCGVFSDTTDTWGTVREFSVFGTESFIGGGGS